MPSPPPEASVVYSLNDLEHWSFEGTSLAVLGHPIEHSISPRMHNAALAEMAAQNECFADWRYFKFDIPPGNLSEALALLHERKFLGINLTVPHKVHAIDLVDVVDPSARDLGAVNTLQWEPSGYHGFNTDGYGFEKALRKDLNTEIGGAEIILLGAGGAARAVAAQCLQSGCRTLWIGNRDPGRLKALMDILKKNTANPERMSGFDLLNPPGDLPSTGILVNATSLGLKSGDPSPLTLGQFDNTLKVCDTIYNPAETALLAEARTRGMAAANGLSMLVWQGVRSLEIWTGSQIPAEVMMTAARQAISE